MAFVALQVVGLRRLYRIGVHGMVGFAADLGMHALVHSLPRRRLGPSAGSAGEEEPREASDPWRCSSLIGVFECLRWTSDCSWLKGWGEGAVRDVFH